MRAPLVALCLALLLPSAAAWNLVPTGTDRGPGLDAAAEVHGAIACAAGDVDADGSVDLMLRTVQANGDVALQALAGPGFQDVLWSLPLAPDAVLACAPDLDADGAAEVMLRLAGEARAQVEGAQQEAQVVLQTVSGATGAVTMTRSITESTTGAAAQGAASVQKQVQGALLPAAQGALGELTVQATGAVALLQGVPASLGVEATSEATLRLVDDAGRLIGTVSVDTPGVAPLAIVPIPGTGLPQVATLTARAVHQVEGAAAQIPTLNLFTPDGRLQWSVELEATTGTPSLLPRPGDLDLDGVADLAVQTTTTLDGVPASALTVVSGLDGQVLLTTQAVTGALAAVPFGISAQATAAVDATASAAAKAPAILQKVHNEGESVLTALDAQGQVVWEVKAESMLRLGNLVRDPFTGDVTGLTDLTGDAVADVAISVATEGSTTIRVLDGVNGEVAWEVNVTGVREVVAVARATGDAAGEAVERIAQDAQQRVAQQAAQAKQRLTDAPGQTADLLAVAPGPDVVLERLDGATGEVVWTASTTLPSDHVVTSVRGLGDVDVDGQGDLLVSAGPATVEATGGGSAGIGEAEGTVAGLGGAGTAVVSGATGALFASPFGETGIDGGGLGDLIASKGAGFRPTGGGKDPGAAEDTPALGFVAAIGLLAVLAVRRR